MRLKIFINEKNFEDLKKSVPKRASAFPALEQAIHLTNIGGKTAVGNAVVSCDDVVARELLMHARESCPTAAATIAEALRAAGLTPY